MQYSKIGLAELLFRNISLLIKVYKKSQFKVKIIVFTTVLRFIGVKLSQVSQFFTISLYLSGSRIYNLNNSGRVLVHILIYRGITVYILGYRGITVHSLKIGCVLAYKINFKGTQVYRINLVKYIRYKASDPIKFKRGKEFINSFNLIQNFLFSLFHLVFFIQYIIQGLYNSNLFIFFNPYTLVM